jgi:hypothetical protein
VCVSVCSFMDVQGMNMWASRVHGPPDEKQLWWCEWGLAKPFVLERSWRSDQSIVTDTNFGNQKGEKSKKKHFRGKVARYKDFKTPSDQRSELGGKQGWQFKLVAGQLLYRHTRLFELRGIEKRF